MLALSGVSAGYDEAEVLHSLDLILSPGMLHGLAGPNGSGKTTLLDVIAGFHPLTQGAVTIGGRPLHPDDVGYLPTELEFFPRITGREYLGVFAASRPRETPEFDADGWATVFTLPLDRLVDDYSAGMRRKLALLGVLSLSRPVMLLDEPGNTLDLEANYLLGRLLRAEADQGRVVIVTSHVVEAFAGCDRVHHLAEGRIGGSYAPHELSRLMEAMMSRQLQDKAALLTSLCRGGSRPGSRG